MDGLVTSPRGAQKALPLASNLHAPVHHLYQPSSVERGVTLAAGIAASGEKHQLRSSNSERVVLL
ncbi:hypothetical protein OIU79_026397 [Salix purpurea]|uniref:Uncharacterized protein n=1 Tax=Salix purpurea TaxID=77065 RepID=A0A9Q0VR95_SALPP|nr:hypothetical protein OIU79_026397 [Salix purpurea]